MANVRSPNYPVVDLAGALTMARKLYEKDGRNKVSRSALAAHLGHDSLSGPALGKIGALRAYGLVDGTGDENRITDDALTALMAPEDSVDRVEALRRMAFQPSLFREIAKEFPTPPSDSNLRYWLAKRGFSPDGAAKAAKTYLATIALATTMEKGYPHSPTLMEDEMMQAPEPSRPIQRRAETSEPPLKPGMRQEIIALDEGDVTITFPVNLSAESFEDLEDHLKLFVRRMQRRANARILGFDEGHDQH
ncbi:hypothetical protein EOA85_15730 [Mesorhizobium sp. M5C.F.Ca.IN.020.29.1.1]|uniref:hypothetical protein n=1 Tax=unclassified Mesorhizobium TaxID=325217 RepID=UPI000FCB47B8|nr:MULTISPECIES: hypothetical protein [unclassified Mesorhizobium]RUV57560.1 hypothetical protein EOA85_15730 [Mesorhizobium sp. M5C.F.Ca.IN.020.29.1.1]TIM84365.1 MAG: hypothetical protein E5Y50_22500 [Mesorhizobium sp.]